MRRFLIAAVALAALVLTIETTARQLPVSPVTFSAVAVSGRSTWTFPGIRDRSVAYQVVNSYTQADFVFAPGWDRPPEGSITVFPDGTAQASISGAGRVVSGIFPDGSGTSISNFGNQAFFVRFSPFLRDPIFPGVSRFQPKLSAVGGTLSYEGTDQVTEHTTTNCGGAATVVWTTKTTAFGSYRLTGVPAAELTVTQETEETFVHAQFGTSCDFVRRYDYTYRIATGALGITPTGLPSARRNVPYGPEEICVEGGTSPYLWSVGTNVPGLGFLGVSETSPCVSIAGTPTAISGPTQQYFVSVSVEDSELKLGSKLFSFPIAEGPVSPLSLSPTSLPAGKVLEPYGPIAICAVGGIAPYSLSGQVNAAGLSLLASGDCMELTGVPLGASTASVVVRVTDAVSTTFDKVYTLVVEPVVTPPAQLKIVGILSSTVFVGREFRSCLTVENGTPERWDVPLSPAPGLQTNVTIDDSQACFGGIPEEEGLYGFTVHVTDTGGNSASANVSLTVLAASDSKKKAAAKIANILFELSLADIPDNLPPEYDQHMSFLRLMSALEAVAGGISAEIAEDPPRMDYSQIAEAVPFPYEGLKASVEVQSVLNSLIANTASVVGVLKALWISMEREQGAALASDLYWEAQQKRAVATYSARFVELMAQRAELLAELVKLPGSDLPPVISEERLRQAQRLLKLDSSDLQATLVFGGLTQPEIDRILEQLQFAARPFSGQSGLFAFWKAELDSLSDAIATLGPVADLLGVVSRVPPAGLRTSLQAKVNAIQKSLAAAKYEAACGQLGALRAEVRALSGGNLPRDLAEPLLVGVQALMSMCSIGPLEAVR